MSHKLFRHSILSNARVWDFLKQVDASEAQACRAARCPRCGGALHSATYPRKPHGLAADLRDDVRRFSLCCSVCRRRVKPASVRFFGRRFYVGALFVGKEFSINYSFILHGIVFSSSDETQS